MKFPSATSFRKHISVICLIATPILFLAADLMAFSESMVVQRQLVTRAALALFVPAMLALGHLLRKRADLLGLIAAGMGILGCMAGVTVSSVILTQFAVSNAGLEAAAVQSVQGLFDNQAFCRTMFLFPFPGVFLPLSLIVFGIGLYHTKVVSRVAAIVLVLAGPLFFVGRVLRVWEAFLASDILLLAAMGMIGWQIFRWTTKDWIEAGFSVDT